jgi:hypothetical protein
MGLRRCYDGAVKKKAIGQILRHFVGSMASARIVSDAGQTGERGASGATRPTSCFTRRYQRRKKAGICVKCGKHPQQKTNVRCADCQEEHNECKIRARAKKRKEREKRLDLQCNVIPDHVNWLNIANTLVEQNRLLQSTARGIQ